MLAVAVAMAMAVTVAVAVARMVAIIIAIIVHHILFALRTPIRSSPIKGAPVSRTASPTVVAFAPQGLLHGRQLARPVPLQPSRLPRTGEQP